MENIREIYDSDTIVIDIVGKDLRISYFEDGHWKNESRLFNFESQENSYFAKETW